MHVPYCLPRITCCSPVLRFSSETMEGNAVGSVPDSTREHVSLSIPPDAENELASDAHEEEPDSTLEEILGKSIGYSTIEESCGVLLVACELLEQQVTVVVMQAGLQLCARLIKAHPLALEFPENGGLAALFRIPRSCFFLRYDTITYAIIQHLLEDLQTLQTAMELEI